MPIGSYFADTFGTYCVIGRRADGYTIARNIATNSTVIFPRASIGDAEPTTTTGVRSSAPTWGTK